MNMDHSSSSDALSMLWNWYTVDSCFLATSWHNKTKGMFAGSVIGVFCLVVAIEYIRRLARDYDRILIKAAKARASFIVDKGADSCVTTFEFTPSFLQQLVRAFAYGSQFTASFLVMLLGMYYNGYILFAIFIGQTVGYFFFGRDTCTATIDHVTSGHCC